MMKRDDEQCERECEMGDPSGFSLHLKFLRVSVARLVVCPGIEDYLATSFCLQSSGEEAAKTSPTDRARIESWVPPGVAGLAPDRDGHEVLPRSQGRELSLPRLL